LLPSPHVRLEDLDFQYLHGALDSPHLRKQPIPKCIGRQTATDHKFTITNPPTVSRPFPKTLLWVGSPQVLTIPLAQGPMQSHEGATHNGSGGDCIHCCHGVSGCRGHTSRFRFQPTSSGTNTHRQYGLACDEARLWRHSDHVSTAKLSPRAEAADRRRGDAHYLPPDGDSWFKQASITTCRCQECNRR